MSKPTCRELMDGGWTNADMDELASRVERVLAFCAESKATFGEDLEHSDPVVRALARGRISAAKQVERRLDGEEP